MISTHDGFSLSAIRLIPGLLVAWLSISASAQGAQQRWVHNDWLDVYGTPQQQSKVVGHWVANTEVSVIKKEGDRCLARTLENNLFPPDSAREGYVACKALGERQLTIKDTHEATALFWVEPSVQHFVNAGQDLNYRALSEKQREQERTEQKPIRFTLPQFEAMKQLLTLGVIPDVKGGLARREVRSFHDLRGDAPANNGDVIEYVKSLQPDKNLPSITPSLFKHHSDALLYLEARPDTVAALLKRANKVSFAGKAEWVNGHQDQGIASIWDIGRVDIQYGAPVVLHSISRFGLVGARRLESATVKPYSPDEGCQDGYPELPSGIDLPDYPHLKEHPLIAFVLAAPLSLKKVDVLTYKARTFAHTDPYSGPKHIEERIILIHTIDITGDDIPDFATIEVGGPSMMEGNFTIARYYHFINVAGGWWFAGFDDYAECT